MVLNSSFLKFHKLRKKLVISWISIFTLCIIIDIITPFVSYIYHIGNSEIELRNIILEVQCLLQKAFPALLPEVMTPTATWLARYSLFKHKSAHHPALWSVLIVPIFNVCYQTANHSQAVVDLSTVIIYEAVSKDSINMLNKLMNSRIIQNAAI